MNDKTQLIEVTCRIRFRAPKDVSNERAIELYLEEQQELANKGELDNDFFNVREITSN